MSFFQRNLFFILYFFLYFSLFSQSTTEQVKPWMGVAIENHPNGVLVKSVIPDTPAFRVGLKTGDIITKIDLQRVKSSPQLIEYILTKGVGNEVKVEFLREKKLQTLTLTLEARPEDLSFLNQKLLNSKLPNFKLKQVKDGKYFTNGDFQGKVLIIEFWETWCIPCRESHKDLSKFAEEEPNIVVLAVSSEPIKILKEYTTKNKYKFLTLQDENSLLKKELFVYAVPTTFVVDTSRTIKHVAIGSGKYQKEAFQKAKDLLLRQK